MIDEPVAKRTKFATSTVEVLDVNNISTNEISIENTAPNNSNNASETDEILWESNYVAVSDVLPFNSLLFVFLIFKIIFNFLI